MQRSRIAMLTIGQEILNGQIEDANTAYVARRLHELGGELVAVMTIPDDIDTIAKAVNLLKGQCDFLITSGGLGSTHDDVTMAGVAKALGQELIRHPYLKTIVGRFCETTDMSAAQLRLAEIPEKAELIVEDDMHIPQPYVDNIYMLPGVPTLFQMRFEKLVPRFALQPFVLDEFTVKGMETQFAAVLNRAVKLHPNVRIGSYPSIPEDYDESLGKLASGTVRVTLQGNTAEDVTAAKEFILQNLPQDISLV